MSRSLILNSTQVPDVILDEWMPVLTPAEFKIVMFIARKTYGWGKSFDRVSFTQLEEGTGLSRSTVKTACASAHATGLLLIDPGDVSRPNAYKLNLNAGCPPPAPGPNTGLAPGSKSDLGQNLTQVNSRPRSKSDLGQNLTLQETKNTKTPMYLKKDTSSPEGTCEGGEGKKSAQKAAFSPPTDAEALAYFTELGCPGQAPVYMDWFRANGWVIGKAKSRMRDWRAAARNWAHRHRADAAKASPSGYAALPAKQMTGAEYLALKAQENKEAPRAQ